MKKFKLKIDWQRVFRVSGRVLLVAGFLVSVGFTEHRRTEALNREVVIRIDDSLGNSFVEKSDIEQLIQNKFGKLEGKHLHSINISLLEKIINNNPFVLKAEVFSTVDGKLNIQIRQRTPVVRVINAYNESYYIDHVGVLMPVSDKFSARVPLANGNIFNKGTEPKIRTVNEEMLADTAFHPTLLEKIFMVSEYVRQHDFWNAQIEQIYVNEEGELELVPMVGNQIIVFGDEKNMEEKFNKLFLLYKEGFSRTGWDQYRTINLTFKDQVVCTKK